VAAASCGHDRLALGQAIVDPGRPGSFPRSPPTPPPPTSRRPPSTAASQAVALTVSLLPRAFPFIPPSRAPGRNTDSSSPRQTSQRPAQRRDTYVARSDISGAVGVILVAPELGFLAQAVSVPSLRSARGARTNILRAPRSGAERHVSGAAQECAPGDPTQSRTRCGGTVQDRGKASPRTSADASEGVASLAPAEERASPGGGDPGCVVYASASGSAAFPRTNSAAFLAAAATWTTRRESPRRTWN
jgi:hypothetical protein